MGYLVGYLVRKKVFKELFTARGQKEADKSRPNESRTNLEYLETSDQTTI